MTPPADRAAAEQRIAAALQRRGLERDALERDVRFHSLLEHTYKRFFAVADPHEALKGLDEAEVMQAAQALGLDPPASAAALELPADLPPVNRELQSSAAGWALSRT